MDQNGIAILSTSRRLDLRGPSNSTILKSVIFHAWAGEDGEAWGHLARELDHAPIG